MAKPKIYEELDQAAVGRRLRAVHEAHGWNSAQFAEMLPGCSASKLANWESGTYLVPVPEAIAACKLTDVNILYIYQGDMRYIDPKLRVRIVERLENPDKKLPRRRSRLA